MQFSKIDITVGAVPYSYEPYDRGQNGAFVYREQGSSLYQPRVVISTAVNDLSSDKYAVQLNHPRVCAPVSPECVAPTNLGTDLVKTELRFLATTTSTDRGLMIDQHIAVLEKMKLAIKTREVIYS